MRIHRNESMDYSSFNVEEFLTDVTPFSDDVDHEAFFFLLWAIYRDFCVFSFYTCNSIIKLSLKEKSVRIVAVDLVFRPIRWL